MVLVYHIPSFFKPFSCVETLGTRPNPGFLVGASSAPREPGKANPGVGIKH